MKKISLLTACLCFGGLFLNDTTAMEHPLTSIEKRDRGIASHMCHKMESAIEEMHQHDDTKTIGGLKKCEDIVFHSELKILCAIFPKLEESIVDSLLIVFFSPSLYKSESMTALSLLKKVVHFLSAKSAEAFLEAGFYNVKYKKFYTDGFVTDLAAMCKTPQLAMYAINQIFTMPTPKAFQSTGAGIDSAQITRDSLYSFSQIMRNTPSRAIAEKITPFLMKVLWDDKTYDIEEKRLSIGVFHVMLTNKEPEERAYFREYLQEEIEQGTVDVIAAVTGPLPPYTLGTLLGIL